MKSELITLIAVLRQVAFDAGCALLFQAAPDAVRRAAAQYHDVCARLHRLDPGLAAACASLPDDASAGSVRIAARDAAAHVHHTLKTLVHTDPQDQAWRPPVGYMMANKAAGFCGCHHA